MLPNTEQLANVKINGFYPYGANEILIATRFQGLYVYDGEQVRPLKTEVDQYLLANKIYDGDYLSDGNYAIATMGNGLVIINPEGKEVFRFDSSNGLGVNQSLFVREINNHLWMGSKNGIFKIAYYSPYKSIGSEFGISGQVTCVILEEPNIYVTTNGGVFRITQANTKLSIDQINNSPLVDCTWLFRYQGRLLMCSLDGLYEIQQDDQIKLVSKIASFRDALATNVEGVFLCKGFYHRLHVLDLRNENPLVYTLPEITRKVTQVVPTGHDSFLALTIDDRLVQLQLNINEDSIDAQFLKSIALNNNSFLIKQNNEVFSVSGQTKQVFQLDNQLNQELIGELTLMRELDKIVLVQPQQDSTIFISYEDSQGNYQTEQLQFDEGNIESQGPSLYSGFEPSSIAMISSRNEIWIGGSSGIISYHQSNQQQAIHNEKIAIRQIQINGDRTNYSPDDEDYVFQHDENNIRIAFTLNSTQDDGSVMYSYQLNEESGWSPWSSDRFVHFTKMSPDVYDFKVRATSSSGNVIEPVGLTFRIRKAWYLSDLALILYALIAVALAYLAYKLRVKSLIDRQNELKDLVDIQTAQLAAANEELSLRANKLERLGAFKSRFFANISHDLRTPIMLLSGRVKQLKNDESSHFSNAAEGFIEKLQSDSESLVRLTNEINDLVEIEEGQVKLQHRPVSINSFFRRVVNLFSSALDQKRLTLEFESEFEESESTKFDPHYIERVVYNLISNAIKFTDTGGWIKVFLTRNENRLLIHVKDNGRGISEEDITEVFNRSFQASNSYDLHEGLGIGLNVVKELVQLHDGSVSVESTLGEGAEFIIELPLISVEMGEEIAIPMEPEESISISTHQKSHKTVPLEMTTHKPLVLLVEDHPDVRDYILEVLWEHFEVIATENGQEALEILNIRSVELIITDLMMPVMDGFEFIQGIKSNKVLEKVPVMVVSARDTQEDKYKIMGMGVNNILVKPFDTDELILRAKNLIKESTSTITVKKLLNHVEVQHKAELDRLEECILAHISDPNLKVSTLADEMNQSERSFYRLVKRLTGNSPLEYIKEVKMQYAMDLIRRKKVSTVKELSALVGMNTVADFSRQFQKRFGSKPSELL